MFSQLTFSAQVSDGGSGHGLGGRVPHRLQQMASRVPAAILSQASPNTTHNTRPIFSIRHGRGLQHYGCHLAALYEGLQRKVLK